MSYILLYDLYFICLSIVKRTVMKIRIKMPNGAEFEAEGSETFIMSERAKFLEVFAPGQPKTEHGNEAKMPAKTEDSSSFCSKDGKVQSSGHAIPDDASSPGTSEKDNKGNAEQPDSSSLFVFDGIEKGSNTDIINKLNNNINNNINNNYIDNDRDLPNLAAGNNIWQNITKKGKCGYFVIPSKPDKLTAQDAVLILLAAEKALKNNLSLPALSISKMVKESGFHHERLDRLLAYFIRSGLVRFEGTKRNRLYSITEQGFQQAALLVHSLFSQKI